MTEVGSLLTEEFKKGLSRRGDDVKVKMHITFIHSVSDGSENGEFLVVNMGGKNFQVLKISKLVSYLQLI